MNKKFFPLAVLAAALLPTSMPAAELAAVPPLGWNSYDAFGDSVTEAETLANAVYMRDKLAAHGWQYVVVDFRWYDPQPTGNDSLLNKTRVGAELAADQYGRLFPAMNRFPSAADGQGFKALAGKIHELGLKFGIHVMRGIPRQAVKSQTLIEGSLFTAAAAGNTNDLCLWCPDMFGVKANAAGQAWYDSIFRLYAEWGLDFVKVDDLSEPYHAAEIEMIRQAIDKCGRQILLSTSPGPTSVAQAGHIRTNAQMWRISGDFWDRWDRLNHQFDLLAQWQGLGGPGHWPDADMIPLGHLAIRSGMGGKDHRSNFTHDEQVMLITLWSLAPSPMMLGMNLPENDGWTLGLFTNDEVLAVNQDKLGAPARRVLEVDSMEVWVKPLADGSRAVGVFNRTGESQSTVIRWMEIGCPGKQTVRDLWRKKDLGTTEATMLVLLPKHGAVMLRVHP